MNVAPATRHLKYFGFYVLVTIILFPFIGVFIYMLRMSLATPMDITKPGLHLFDTITFENYISVFRRNDIALFTLNSAIIAVGSTGLALVFGTPAAFAIVHRRLDRLAGVILLTRATPGISLLLPWFVIFADIGWIDTYQALIIAHLVVNLPLVVWMMTNFFRDVPRELVEAAQIDGASIQHALVRIVLPMVRPGLIAVAVLSFILSWNNFMFSVVLSVDKTKTLPVAAFGYLSYGNVEWGAIMAVSVIMTIPVLVLALPAQRQLVAGLSGRTEL